MASEVSWYNIGVSDCRFLSGDWRIAHLHTCVYNVPLHRNADRKQVWYLMQSIYILIKMSCPLPFTVHKKRILYTIRTENM